MPCAPSRVKAICAGSCCPAITTVWPHPSYGAGVWVLPAPCTHRRPGRDLTETMAAATPEGAVRIGLGHGAVTDFASDEGSPGIIHPA